MHVVDIILFVTAILFAASGWRNGFVRAGGNCVAFITAVIAAYYGMTWLHEAFGVVFTMYPWLTVIAFLLLLIGANRIAKLFVHALDGVRKAIGILPLVNTMNALFGAILGIVYFAAIGMTLVYLVVLLLPAGDLRTTIFSSAAVAQMIDLETRMGLL
jgi:uncharacterized membrane protein required for colicin V production